VEAFDAFLDEGQADAGAGEFFLGVEAVEEGEDFFVVFGGYPNAVVADFDGGSGGVGFSGDLDVGNFSFGNKF